MEKIKKEIAKKINRVLQQNLVQAADLVAPVNYKHGDLTLPCFLLGKAIGKNPVEAAGWLVGKIKIDEKLAGVQAVGPYVNFTLQKEKIFQLAIFEILKYKKEYGQNNSGKKKRVMIEYSNANTHKEYHIGHLRNICFGDSIFRLLSANGYKCLAVSYINDFGIHVAKTLWRLYHKDNKKILAEFRKTKAEMKGFLLGKVYVEANKVLEELPEAKQEVSEIMKKIESRRGEIYQKWAETRSWSIKYFNQIYKELGVRFSHIFYESQFIEEGRKLTEKLYKEGVFKKSEGAIIADLSQYNLGVLVIIRADGTALYPVADLPLALRKFKGYKVFKSIYVVDIRQSLYFKQLFKLISLLGVKGEMIHLAYDFVKLPSGMISSRTGNMVTYRDLFEAVFSKALAETKSRHKSWSKKKIRETARSITVSILKFEMVKVGANQIITFDINQALQFDGFTAVYLQYSAARINSIIRKSKMTAAERKIERTIINQPKNNRADKATEKAAELEHLLVLKLMYFPEVVAKAGAAYDQSLIAKYLFDLARVFNDYYHSVPILKADKEVRVKRLQLIRAIKQVLTNGLHLLGISCLSEI